MDEKTIAGIQDRLDKMDTLQVRQGLAIGQLEVRVQTLSDVVKRLNAGGRATVEGAQIMNKELRRQGELVDAIWRDLNLPR